MDLIFGSIEFLLYFLPVFLILYGITPQKLKNFTLLAGSLVFYAMGEIRYLLLLVVSIFVNYWVGLSLERRLFSRKNRYGRTEQDAKSDRRRILLLWGAVIGNMALLCVFKAGLDPKGLPLGISYYTFQIVSYLADVYRGKIPPEQSPLKLGVYITMFPKMLSGPITRYDQVKEALDERRFTVTDVHEGLKVFVMGLAAKVLLADRIGLLWNQVQTVGFESLSIAYAWMGAISYSMMIYFDFYGYSLMARGLGRMLGFDLPYNFREPYLAKGVRDFYRRWHVTLGRWFRDYVYVPLGGSRGGALRTALNLMVVWFLTGIWHGTSVNFLIWGMLLCLCIIMERAVSKIPFLERLIVLPRLYLWIVIPVSWMCFAIPDLSQLQIYLGRMFGLVEGINVSGQDWYRALLDYGWLFLVCFVSCTPVVRRLFYKVKQSLVGQILLALLFWLCVHRLLLEGNNPFLYLNF